MNLTGTWLGEYVYGPDYGAIAGKAVPFTMSLTDSWLRGVAGYVRDDASRGGMPERGRIRGLRRRAVVRFVKTMPNGYLAGADGKLVSSPEAAAQQGGKLPEVRPPHRILYEGRLAADADHLAGTWRIPGPGAHDIGTGTWSARRVAHEPSAV